MLKSLLVAVGFVFLSAASAAAQIIVTPGPTTQLVWDHNPAPQTDGYTLQVDEEAPVVLSGVSQDDGDTFYVSFPALTPGQHTLRVRAFNGVGSSGPAVLVVTVVVTVPEDPTNLRIRVVQEEE